LKEQELKVDRQADGQKRNGQDVARGRVLSRLKTGNVEDFIVPTFNVEIVHLDEEGF
jgi:hypothetical protein